MTEHPCIRCNATTGECAAAFLDGDPHGCCRACLHAAPPAPTYLAPVRDEIARLRAENALLSDALARRSDALNRTGRHNDHLRAIVARVEKVAADCEWMGRNSIDKQNREWLPAFAKTLRAALADPTSPTAIREPK